MALDRGCLQLEVQCPWNRGPECSIATSGPYGPPGGTNLFVIQFDASISSRIVRRTSVASVAKCSCCAEYPVNTEHRTPNKTGNSSRVRTEATTCVSTAHVQPCVDYPSDT